MKVLTVFCNLALFGYLGFAIGCQIMELAYHVSQLAATLFNVGK
jgi:hypothetical protein